MCGFINHCFELISRHLFRDGTFHVDCWPHCYSKKIGKVDFLAMLIARIVLNDSDSDMHIVLVIATVNTIINNAIPVA